MKVYRSAKSNQEMPFYGDFPKYLASFRLEEEVTLRRKETNETKETEEDDELELESDISFCRILHTHKDGKSCECSQRWYHGLSFRDGTKSHSGLLAETVEQAKEISRSVIAEIARNKGTVVETERDEKGISEKVPVEAEERKQNFFEVNVSWIPDPTMRKKALKKLQESIVHEGVKYKFFVRTCYSYDLTHCPRSLCVIRDGLHCSEAEDCDHVTIYPNEDELPGSYIRIASDTFYAFYEPLLTSGWAAHCIQMVCLAEPRPFDSHFDKPCHNACRVLFNNLETINDYHVIKAILTVINLLDRNDYHIDTLNITTDKVSLFKEAVKGILDVADAIHDYSQLTNLLRFCGEINSTIEKCSPRACLAL